MEELLDEMVDAAYDRAVAVVANTVRTETHKADLEVIQNYHKYLIAPERKISKSEKKVLDKCFTIAERKMREAFTKMAAKVAETLQKPTVKKVQTEKIKSAARKSIAERLSEAKSKTGEAANRRQSKEITRETGTLER